MKCDTGLSKLIMKCKDKEFREKGKEIYYLKIINSSLNLEEEGFLLEILICT